LNKELKLKLKLNTVYSIGHSSHDWATFKGLLDVAGIEVVLDVRSYPASRLPHFNRYALEKRLFAEQIGYAFYGFKLGGRPASGVTDYEEMATNTMFIDGLAEVEATAMLVRAALMCSEHEPISCHRCLLVGRRLVERGVEVAHILRDGSIEPHQDTEERLLKLAHLSNANLLISRADRLAAAYRAQNLKLSRKMKGPPREYHGHDGVYPWAGWNDD
jgi:uncharacterized protein (DUF488 family)